MKKIILVLLAVSFLPASLAFSQGAYFQLGGGYGLSSGSQVIGQNTTSNGTTTTYEGIFGSFGEGFKFGLTGGAMFTKNLGAELGVMYLLGKTFEETDATTGANSTSNSVTKRSGTGLFFAPAFVVAAPLQGFTPYAKLGMVIGIPKGKAEMTSTSTSGGTTNSYATKEEVSGGLALGYLGGVGAVFEVGKNVGLFAELLLVAGSWSPSTNELTELTINGVDKLADYTDPAKSTFYRHRSIDYKDSYTPTAASAANPHPNNPMLSVRRPFGSFGVNVGVRITV